jgi:hypothetical protein
LPSRPTRSWQTVRGRKSLNDKRVATYERLMDAQERIAEARYRRGESQATIENALAVSELSDSEVELEEDLYLRTLARYVAALGGRLDVVAVFPEETIALRQEPDDRSRSDPE